MENLKAVGMEVAVVEMEEHLMRPLDKDVSIYLKDTLIKNGIHMYLNDSVLELEGDEFAKRTDDD